MNRNPEVDAYLATAPEDQRALLRRLRTLIRKSMPQAEEGFMNGMPVYTQPGARVWSTGFAWRKDCARFYVMSPFLDRFATELGKNRSGKSCVAMKPTKALSLPQLEALAARILAELPS